MTVVHRWLIRGGLVLTALAGLLGGLMGYLVDMSRSYSESILWIRVIAHAVVCAGVSAFIVTVLYGLFDLWFSVWFTRYIREQHRTNEEW